MVQTILEAVNEAKEAEPTKDLDESGTVERRWELYEVILLLHPGECRETLFYPDSLRLRILHYYYNIFARIPRSLIMYRHGLVRLEDSATGFIALHPDL